MFAGKATFTAGNPGRPTVEPGNKTDRSGFVTDRPGRLDYYGDTTVIIGVAAYLLQYQNSIKY